jgi:NAD(P)-dependent dehydrogenase (short-subunit alcohol dehydrogenase family)
MYSNNKTTPIKQLIAIINNAGTAITQYVELIPINELRQQYEVNVFGHIAIIQRFLPLLRVSGTTQRTARLINITSVAARLTVTGQGIYSSSKHSMRSLNGALRQELKRTGQYIDVIDIQPGSIDTEIHNTAGRKRTELWNHILHDNSNNNTGTGTGTDDEDRQIINRYYALEQEQTAKREKHHKLQPVSYVIEQLDAAVRDRYPLTTYQAGMDANMTLLFDKLPDRVQDYIFSFF